MTGPEQISSDIPLGREPWLGRYTVRAEVNYRGRHGKAGTMQVITYQSAIPDDEVILILEPLGFNRKQEGWTHLVSQARDTFTKEQAEVLVNYLNSRQGTTAYMKLVYKPLPVLMGASAISSLPSFRDGIVYRLYTERGYNLPFKVEAVNMKTYLYMARLFTEFQGQEKGEQSTEGD